MECFLRVGLVGSHDEDSLASCRAIVSGIKKLTNCDGDGD